MKKILVLGFVLLFYKNLEAALNIPNAVEANFYLKNNIEAIKASDFSLQLTHSATSKVAIHYTFSVYYKNVELQNNTIKLHTLLNGDFYQMEATLNDLFLLHTHFFNVQLAHFLALNPKEIIAQSTINLSSISNSNVCIIFIDNHPILSLKINAIAKTIDKSYWINQHGEIIKQYDYTRHYKDTIIQANIFKPDPLTSSNQVYGGIYINNNDSNSTWLNNQLYTVTINASYDTTTQQFILQNKYASIEDFENPSISVAISNNPNFIFNRSESGFEDCNTLYHINNLRHIINPLGYTSLLNEIVHIDTHGQFGADNSVFNRNAGFPNLSLGTGGVDDAEDADVIIHEYAHGLSWSANNNGVFSQERAGLDEGVCDYFCTSYSRQMNNYNWGKVFSWDGHNEFWAGRTANLNTNYTPNFTGNIYTLGEMWNTAMSRIETSLGPTKTNTLMLEALYYFTDNTTLPDAAKYILKADSLLYGGIDSLAICNGFKSNQIITDQCGAINTSSVTIKPYIEISNSQLFATNQNALVVHFKEKINGTLHIINIQGQKIKSMPIIHQNQVQVYPYELHSGLYILQINTNKFNYSFKVNKL